MTSTPRTYFEEMYAVDADPWDLGTSAYERRKYAITMASLPRIRYRSAFEPGCSVGVLSELLATRCDQLLATDIIDVALDQATHRLQAFPHVRVERCEVPREWPRQVFDLVVLSEVGYYFDEDGVARLMRNVADSTLPGAHVAGVHWRGDTNYPLSGDEVQELLGSAPGFRRLVHHVEGDFALDVWERTA